MPRLIPGQVPTIRLAAGADPIEETLTDEQRRALFEQPGTTVTAVVTLAVTSYTGHTNAEKDPQVKVTVVSAEAARDVHQEQQLAEVMRAMYRRREMAGTLDEAGTGERVHDQAVDDLLDGHPDEDDFRSWRRDRRGRD